MKTRRELLQYTGAAFAAFPFLKAFAQTKKPSAKSAAQMPGGPIVVSTWNFGMQANAEAWKILGNGGHALDAIIAGVAIPEADPKNTSVGLGGLPDRDGRVTLDACVMDENGQAGSVACVEHIVHVAALARRVMEQTPHVMLVADGALKFALDNGFPRENLLTAESEKAWREWLKTAQYKPGANIENHDTIGMVALDAAGNLSGACTTSGMAYKMHGRVGDSPLIGAGLFVDNEVGAATSTGVGEEVIKICGSHLVVEQMRLGKSPEEACRIAVERIVKKNPEKRDDLQVGFLALNKHGEHGAFCILKGFQYAVRSNSQNVLIDGKAHFA